MKTLDEVIKALEYCTDMTKSDCGSCPFYEAPDCMVQNDALEWLKEYRSDKLLWEADRKHWDEEATKTIAEYREAKDKFIAKCKELDIGTLNPPLTWDELRQMECKPVWVELLKSSWKGWDVVGGFDKDDFGVAMVTVHNDDYYREDLGKTWQAYRKERG